MTAFTEKDVIPVNISTPWFRRIVIDILIGIGLGFCLCFTLGIETVVV